MKNKIKKFAPVALFMISLITLAGNDIPAYCLEFSLVTRLRTSSVPGCRVTLMENNAVIDTLSKPNSRMRYLFFLKENTCYTLVISCKGYHDRKVSISTRNPNGVKPGVIYHMDVIVQMLPDKRKIDDSFSDHPIAIVEYMPEKDVFDIRKKYTRNYKKKVQAGQRK